MKIKRFNNLWAMGLILCGVILVALFVARICFPEFIIGVAEIPRIVEFGTYVDSHLWSYYLFTYFTSFCGGYVYSCACCKKKILDKKGILILAIFTLLPLVFYQFFPQVYTPMLYVCFLLMPLTMFIVNKENDYKLAINIILCFSLDIVFACLTVIVRDISLLVSYPNSATFSILLIDCFIWRVMLYLFCNDKKGEQNNG